MATQVDFDYNGPPVSVSNGMALQLVSQFGVRNAWFAFLKLRGMMLSNEEADRAKQSFVYFCNKIGHLRREATELNGPESAVAAASDEVNVESKAEKLEALMNADFDNFLAASDSLELRPDVPAYAYVDEKELLFNNSAESFNETQNGAAPPTTASLLQMIEQSKNNKIQKQQLERDCGEQQKHEDKGKCDNGLDEQGKEQHRNEQTDDDKLPISEAEKSGQNELQNQTASSIASDFGKSGKNPVQGSQQQTTTANTLTTTTKAQKSTGKGNKSSAKTVAAEKDDAETKQVVEKLLAAKEEIARRHAETIDDVVSLVMEKIRNNQPFEGELSIGTINNAGAGPSKSHHHHKRAALNSPTGAPGGSQRQPGTKIGGAAHHKKGAAPIPAVESQPQPGVFGTAEILQRQQAQQLEMPINTNSTISSGLSAGAPIMATAPAGTFSHLPPGQSIVLLHNPVTGTMEIPAYSMAQPVPAATKLHGGQHHYQVHHSHLPQQSSADQMTILSNYPEIIRPSTTLTTSTNAAKMVATGGIHSQQQQQHANYGTSTGHQIVGQMMETQGGAGVAMPVEVAIQQNMTVQELIQTLKSQSRHQNTQIIFHHAPNLPPHPQATGVHPQLPHNRQPNLQQQQETPDSSSQEASMLEAHGKLVSKQAEFKGANGVGPGPLIAPKKGRKRKATVPEVFSNIGIGGGVATAAIHPSPTKQPKTQQKSTQKNEILNETAKEEGNMVTAIDMNQEQTPQNMTTTKKSSKSKKGKAQQVQEKETMVEKASTSEVKSEISATELKQQQERIDELESQLRKLNKQLTTEHNKSSGQKKRVEKLQAELDKAMDSIQLLQIDLACQKTDNNNLIAENIALKAENQQLRSKGQRAAAAASSSSTTSSNAAQTASNAAELNNIAGGARSRKKKANEQSEDTVAQSVPKVAKSGRNKKAATAISPAEEKSPSLPLPERTRTPPPLSMELGRRQSKRICVARNQFMKNLF